MYFLALLLALSQIICCWAIDTRILEVDLILPRNDTYPPSPIFPIIFAVQNPSLAKSFQPMITLQVEQVDGNFSTIDTFKLWESSNDTSSTRFLNWGTSKFDFEGNFRFTWDLSMDRCSLDKETDEVNFGRFSEFQSLYFTTKNGTSPADFVAATDDNTCDKALAQAINYADLSKLPTTESTYGPSCLAEPTTLPKPTNPCNAKINSSAAATSNGDTCTSFAASWDSTLANFQALNSGVSCPTLTVGQSYFVVGTVTSEPGTTTKATTPTTSTTTKAATTTTPSQYEPTIPGVPSNCDGFHLVASGDQCDAIEAKYGIADAQFKAWNPRIDSKCSNLWLNYYVCVHVPGATTTPSTPQPTSTGPEPQMPGIVSTCKTYYKVKSGDSCYSIDLAAGIILAQFRSWNTQVDATCTNLWVDYYVCTKA